jgi:hypothetical protein
MTILTFLGTVDIEKNDDYGRINLRLALDLLGTIRSRAQEGVIKDKARNLIQVRCEPMFDNLTDEYDWSFEEFLYADGVIAKCIEVATNELLEIAQRRIPHRKKHERRTKLLIEDMKLGAIMAYIMSVHDLVHDRLQDSFTKDHGSMYFST